MNDTDIDIPQARIIPPEDHPITREMIDPDALFILRKLNRAGFSAYLVGGGVRDLYLGKKPKDFDISTEARPGQIRKLFPNSNTIGRRFRLVQIFFRHGKTIEVSTLRSLSEHDLDGPEAVLAPNNTFGTLGEDAQRRDLTINSLFYEIEHHTIIDYVNGVQDLDNSLIRFIGDPEKRINRDPVRMLRAIRHCARNTFTIEPASWQAICANHHKLTLCPPSRLRDELLKDIYSGSVAAWFNLAVDSGIFLALFPIYRQALHSSNQDNLSGRDQLARLMAVIDRINTRAATCQVSRQSDFFHLALMLIPWAAQNYQLYSRTLKGPALYQLSKQIRADLDRDLGVQLNLRRSLRQDMTTLLTNLSLFIQHNRHNSWPKWLQKKSYFKQCALFHQCYLEAETGNQVDDKFLNISPANKRKDDQRRSSRSSSRKKGRPAFTSKKKGGVFGLKK